MAQNSGCYTVDANVIIRIILGDIPAQQEAALAYIENHELVVLPLLAIYESVYVLETVYEWPRKKIVNDLLRVMNHQHCQAQAEHLVRASLGQYQTSPKLAFADCVLSAQTAQENCQLATFDRKLVNQGGNHVQLLEG